MLSGRKIFAVTLREHNFRDIFEKFMYIAKFLQKKINKVSRGFVLMISLFPYIFYNKSQKRAIICFILHCAIEFLKKLQEGKHTPFFCNQFGFSNETNIRKIKRALIYATKAQTTVNFYGYRETFYLFLVKWCSV